MWLTAEVELRLNLTEKTTASFGDKLELSLDCMICQRRHRTVNFKRDNSICLKTGHPFPGQILQINHFPDGVIYQIGYYYQSFQDLKKQSLAQPDLTWGRITFLVHCPQCDRTQSKSVQSNTTRPYTAHCCADHAIPSFQENSAISKECEYPLFEERDVYPIFRY